MNKNRNIISLILEMLIVVLMAGFASGADIYVDPNMPDDSGDGLTVLSAKKTVPAAIVSANDGDNVYLLPGTYDSTPNSQGAGWYINITVPKSLLIKPYYGGNITLTTDNSWACVRINADDSPNNKKTVAFENLTFSMNNGDRFIYYDPEQRVNLSFTDCIFDTSKDKPLIYAAAVTTEITRQISFIRCTYTNYSVLYPMQFLDCAEVVFDECILTNDYAKGSCIFFDLWNEIGKFVLRNSTVTSKANGFYPQRSSLEIDELIIQDNQFIHPEVTGVFNYAICVPDRPVGIVNITGNTIEYTNTTAGFIEGIRIGSVATQWNNQLNMPVISGNYITSARPGFYGSGMLIGTNVRGATCVNNTILGFHGGIQMFGQYCLIKGNTIKCTDGINMWGGSYNYLLNNSLVSVNGHADGRALMFGRDHFANSTSNTVFTDTTVTDNGPDAWSGDQANVEPGLLAMACDSGTNPTHWGVVQSISSDTITVDKWITANLTPTIATPTDGKFVHIVRFSEHNTVLNNIVDSSSASYTMTFDFNPRCGEDYIDYNCYRAGTSLFSNLGETYEYSLSAMQSKWSSWSSVYNLNDQHSFEADPLFIDIANADFRLDSNSPCLNAGMPTPQNGYTSIGAWGGYDRSVLLEPNCLEPMEMDFNNDCTVDILDFSIFAQSWMLSNIVP